MVDPATTSPFHGEGVTLRMMPGCTRLSLRCRPEDAAALAPGIGLALPPLLHAATAPGRAALMLGPDEWLLLAEDVEAREWAAQIEAAAAGAPVSVVDISHRQVAILAEGPLAALVLAEGCPLDLDDAAFPSGRCTRTLFGKVEITLWRPTSQPGFRIEAARSFGPHLWQHLVEAAADEATPVRDCRDRRA